MTEQRFTLAYSDNSEKSKWWAVRDGDITLWKEEVVYLLNQLHEENEELRRKNNAYIQDIEIFREENTILKLENKELHQLNQEYIDSLSGEKKETLSEMLNAILGDDEE